MYNCLIMQRSVTYARKAQKILATQGITSYVTRPPLALSGGECAHALKVRERDLYKCAPCLRQAAIPVDKAYIDLGGNRYREICLV